MMTGLSARALDIAAHPACRAANRHVAALDALPLFTPKWSDTERHYRPDELTVPESLFAAGALTRLPAAMIGVGGTRSPDAAAFEQALALCTALAGGGAALISGGVPGIDLAGHLASVSARAPGVAVLANPPHLRLGAHGWACGLLEDALGKAGLFLSEYRDRAPVGSTQYRARLLQRDRIISGLSDIFIAFECRADSATVDTAWRALAQGKRVVAIHPPHFAERDGTRQLAADPRVIAIDGGADMASAAARIAGLRTDASARSSAAGL